nr:MAG TPA: hypothetical protein [Caudoviricetes sp.]
MEILNDYAGWWPTLRPGQREKVRTWLWPGWRYRCRAMPQRTGRLPSGWASLPLGNRIRCWPNTIKPYHQINSLLLRGDSVTDA